MKMGSGERVGGLRPEAWCRRDDRPLPRDKERNMKEDRKVLDSMQEILERLVLETSALKAENARLVRKVEGM